MFIGQALFGKLLKTMSWNTAGYLMIPVCAIGAVTAWLAKIR
jgi:hypothetical protein